MRFRGIFFGVVVLAGAAIAVGAPTAGAMPTNDVSEKVVKIFVRDVTLEGVRLRAERIDNHLFIDPEDPLTTPAVDDGDPPLLQPAPRGDLQTASTCNPAATVLGDPMNTGLYATRTVWYELTQDSAGTPFGQRTLVTVDTGGSTFTAALEVFAGSAVPPLFVRTAPVLPTGVVACDRNSGSINASATTAAVSFVTEPGKRYYLLAGIAPGTSTPVSPSMKLSMRILDIDPPVVTVKLDQIPDVNSVFEYAVGTPDSSAVGSLLTVTQMRGSTKKPIKRLLLGSKCDAAHLKSRTRAGTYCMRGSSVYVHWNPVSSTSESGQVLIKYRDPAGNVGTNSLQTQLRDRVAPAITRASARWTKRGRLFVTATCTGGPGKINVQYGTGKKSAGKGTVFNSTRNTTMRLKQAYPKVTRRTTFVHIVCNDKSGNADDTWLFLPR